MMLEIKHTQMGHVAKQTRVTWSDLKEKFCLKVIGRPSILNNVLKLVHLYFQQRN